MEENDIALELDAPEVISIRDGEGLNEKNLAAYLRDKLPGADVPLRVEQFSGGHANLTYLLSFGDREYVLRRPPLGPVAATSHDMGREFKVLSVLFKAFPPAPQAFLYCEDPDVIGAPFFIMERKHGIVVRGTIPAPYGSGKDPQVNRLISEVLVDTLAEIHKVDYRRIGLETLGKPEGFMERQIKGWAGRYEQAKTKEIEVVDEIFKWLMDKLPDSSPSAIVHNDWRLDNIMLSNDDPGKVIGVFDWDMCTLGDPMADMGCLLSLWLEKEDGIGVSSQGVMPTQEPGFMTRQEAIDRYGEKSGLDVSRMPFYYCFGLFKMAVVVQQIYYRYEKGQTKDKRFRFFGALAELMMGLGHSVAMNSGL